MSTPIWPPYANGAEVKAALTSIPTLHTDLTPHQSAALEALLVGLHAQEPGRFASAFASEAIYTDFRTGPTGVSGGSDLKTFLRLASGTLLKSGFEARSVTIIPSDNPSSTGPKFYVQMAWSGVWDGPLHTALGSCTVTAKSFKVEANLDGTFSPQGPLTNARLMVAVEDLYSQLTTPDPTTVVVDGHEGSMSPSAHAPPAKSPMSSSTVSPVVGVRNTLLRASRQSTRSLSSRFVNSASHRSFSSFLSLKTTSSTNSFKSFISNSASLSQSPTLIEALFAAVDESPEELIFALVDGHSELSGTLTRSQLLEAAYGASKYLTSTGGLEPGDRALMLLPPSLEFIVVFVGALLAGIIPVPVAPPNPMQPAESLSDTLISIADSCKASALISTRSYVATKTMANLKSYFSGSAAKYPDLPWVYTAWLSLSRGFYAAEIIANYPLTELPQLDDLAFLQYTSGSTSEPKGVKISYGNLQHQLTANAGALGLTSSSVSFTWVPHFHDLGLISCICSALVGNGSLYFSSPLDFLSDPVMWIQALSRYNVTHSCAPNFAYDLVVKKFMASAVLTTRLDLSCLKALLSAGETVHLSTLRRFTDAFMPYGLSPQVFHPAYGLAEHTVGITMRGASVAWIDRSSLEAQAPTATSPPEPIAVAAAAPPAPVTSPVGGSSSRKSSRNNTISIVGVGTPLPQVDMRIVDPTSCELAVPGHVGEVWVNSPSVALGYYNRPVETEKTFKATIVGIPDKTYLRTGDLGWVDPQSGELYICGRLKDMIIIRGSNLYPEDMEQAIRYCHSSIRPGGVAVVASYPVDSSHSSAPNVIVAVEVAKGTELGDFKTIATAIASTLAENYQISGPTVALFPANTIPKTTSGKVQRRKLLSNIETASFLDHALHVEDVNLHSSGRSRASSMRLDTAPTVGLLTVVAPRRRRLSTTPLGSRASIATTTSDTSATISVPSSTRASMSSLPTNTPTPGLDELITSHMSEAFNKLVWNVATGFAARGSRKKGRATHTYGVAGTGVATVVYNPMLPDHEFFTPGRQFRVLVRHASIKGFRDDAIADGRGATVRLLPLQSPDPATLTNPSHQGLLDIIMSTGTRFFLPTAETFQKWYSSDLDSRKDMLLEHPSIAPIFWDIVRDPTSFADLSYYSQTTYQWTSRDGSPYWMRYRLVRPDANDPDRAGKVPFGRLSLPLDYIPRQEGDLRSKTHLLDEFRNRVTTDGVMYQLQVQLRPRSDQDAWNQHSDQSTPHPTDCTFHWPEESYPWAVLLNMDLNDVMQDSALENMAFSPARAPPSLSILKASSPQDPASINHIRAIVYAMSAHARINPGDSLGPFYKHMPLTQAVPMSLQSAYERLCGWNPEDSSEVEANELLDTLAKSALGAKAGLMGHLKAEMERLCRFSEQFSPQHVNNLLLETNILEPSLKTLIDTYAMASASFGDSTFDGPRYDAILAQSHTPVCIRVILALHDPSNIVSKVFSAEDALLEHLAQGRATQDQGQWFSSVPYVSLMRDDLVLAVSRVLVADLPHGRCTGWEYAVVYRKLSATEWRIQSVVSTDVYRPTMVSMEPERATDIVKEFLFSHLPEDRVASILRVALVSHIMLELLITKDQDAAKAWNEGVAALKPLPSAPRRVAVVGGGPTGLALSRKLEEAGHITTVFEAGLVAGKARTVLVDNYACNLGAHICTGAYKLTSELATQLGVGRSRNVDYFDWHGEKGSSASSVTLMTPQLWKRYQDIKAAQFPTIEEAGLSQACQHPEMTKSASQWLVDNQMEDLRDVFQSGWYGAGYGRLDDVPIGYFLKYIEKTGLVASHLSPSWTPAGGFAGLWERVSSQLPDVREESPVVSVDRYDFGVFVELDGGGREVRGGRVAFFQSDDVALCGPPTDCIDLLSSPSASEMELVPQVRYRPYWTVIGRASGLPQNGFYLIKRNLDALDGALASFMHSFDENSDLYMFYCYSPPGDEDTLLRSLDRDVSKAGGHLEEVIMVREWKFFPHVHHTSAANGWFDQWNSFQGQNRTFWASPVGNFELIESVLEWTGDFATRNWTTLEDRARVVSPPKPNSFGICAEMEELERPLESSLQVTDMTLEGFEAFICRWLSEEKGVALSDVDPSMPLEMFGLSSVDVMSLLGTLSDTIGARLDPAILLEYATIQALAGFLAESKQEVQHDGSPSSSKAEGSTYRSPPVIAVTSRSLIQSSAASESRSALEEGRMQDPLSLLPVRQPKRDVNGPKIRLSGMATGPTAVSVISLASDPAKKAGSPLLKPRQGSISRQKERSSSFGSVDVIADALAQTKRRLSERRSYLQQTTVLSSGLPAPVAKIRLYCFHHAGGSAHLFDEWSEMAPSWCEIYPVALPGHGLRIAEQPLQTLDRLLAYLWASLDLSSGPYALFGHSFGALLAFELARRTTAAARAGVGRGVRAPEAVLLSGTLPYHFPREGTHVSDMDDSQVVQLVEELGGLSAANSQLMTGYIPVIRADLGIVQSYKPYRLVRSAPPLTCRLGIFMGAQDPCTISLATDPSKAEIAWDGYTSSKSSIKMFAGDHFYLQDGVKVVVAAVMETLLASGVGGVEAAAGLEEPLRTTPTPPSASSTPNVTSRHEPKTQSPLSATSRSTSEAFIVGPAPGLGVVRSGSASVVRRGGFPSTARPS